jgi:very-short-patch-repair endonuclease
MRHNMTPAEKRLWSALRANRLGGLHFRRQQIIDGFIVDFYCHTAGLVVEVDGPVHSQQVDYDAERDRALTARGLHILRVKNEEVMQNLQDVLNRIQTAIDLTPQPPSLTREGGGSPLLTVEEPGEGLGERSGEGSP